MSTPALRCDDDLEPDPPTRDEIELSDDVDWLVWSFDNVTANETAFRLSNALASLDNAIRRRRPVRPSPQERDRLIAAIRAAGERVMAALAHGYPVAMLHGGLEAAVGLVMRWAEDDAARAAQPADQIRDLSDRARVLRNDMHNLDLWTQIAERAAKRQSPQMEALLEYARRCFEAVSVGGADALYEAAHGLRTIYAAATYYDTRSASPVDVARVCDAAMTAIPAVAKAAEAAMADRIYRGFGAAAGLLNLFGKTLEEMQAIERPELTADRLDHVALLADELDALHRRRRIAERGDVLARLVAIRMAANQSAARGAPLH